MSSQSQLGFSFEAYVPQPSQETPYVAETPLPDYVPDSEEIADPPPEVMDGFEEDFPEEEELEQTVLFEGFAPVREDPEPEIPWAAYTHKVELYFDEAQFAAYRENVSKLALKYGTKSVTETIAANLQRAADGTN